jgi:hypothetical protein
MSIYKDFEKDVINTICIYKKLVGGFAPVTEKILDYPDKIKVLSNLMKSADVQKGFKVLRNSKQLDKTFESLILKYQKIFKNDVVEAAQWRIDNADELDKKY